jgi:hypothetical protein
MTAYFDTSVQDAALNQIATATALYICSGTPTTRATVLSSALATVTVASGDFTKAAGTVDGRKVTVAAKSGVSVTASGTAGSYCLVDGSILIARADVDASSPALTSGSTTNIPAVSFEVGAPVTV